MMIIGVVYLPSFQLIAFLDCFLRYVLLINIDNSNQCEAAEPCRSGGNQGWGGIWVKPRVAKMAEKAMKEL